MKTHIKHMSTLTAFATAHLLVACGGTKTSAVDARADLPECTEDEIGEIYFVTDEENLNICTKAGWKNLKTENESDQSRNMVSKSSELPACNTTIEGHLYFVQDLNAFQVCKSTIWTTVAATQGNTSVSEDSALPICDASLEGRVIFVESTKTNNICKSGVWSAALTQKNSATTTTALPTCDASREGVTFYVEDIQAYSICKSKTWTAVTLPIVSSRWRFHTDTYVGQTDLLTDSARAITLGTIQLTRFSDGTAYVSIAGTSVDTDSATNTYAEDFGHSFSLSASTSAQQVTIKLDSYAISIIRYTITLSSTPAFTATADSDGNSSNNTEVSFSLSQQ